MSKFSVTLAAALSAFACLSTPLAAAETYGGVEFPGGEASFADVVVTYAPGDPAPTNPYQGAFNALGIPDYAGANGCASQETCTFLSLGNGGSATFQFTDNLLTGSGDDGFDLWIFEIGPDVEDTFVEISADGITFFSVGSVGGATAGIDIDAYGFGVGSTFAFVRLTDDPNEGATGGATVGADIDAVGAISTIQIVPAVPEPATWGLMLLGFFGIGATMRARPAEGAMPAIG